MTEDRFSQYRQDKAKKEKPFLCRENVLIMVVCLIAILVWIYALPRLLVATGVNNVELQTETKGSYILNESPLVLVQIDVGQGNCVFIKFPNGKTLLYDGGEGDRPDNKYGRAADAGRKIVVPFLKWLGVRKIDYILLSHPDSDHCGGMDYVLKSYQKNIGLYSDGGTKVASFTYKRVLEDVDKYNIDYKILKDGDELDWGGPLVKLKIIAADIGAVDTNDNSVVLYGKFGNFSFMLTGDATIESEYRMIKRYGPQLKTTVLQVGHHGSKTATSTEWLNTIKPEYATIGVGSYNTYGHPTKIVLDKLKRSKSDILRTDKDGTILFTTNGKEWKYHLLDEWRLENM